MTKRKLFTLDDFGKMHNIKRRDGESDASLKRRITIELHREKEKMREERLEESENK